MFYMYFLTGIFPLSMWITLGSAVILRFLSRVIKSLTVIDQVMRITMSLLPTELPFHLCNVEALKNVWTDCDILHYSLSCCPDFCVCCMPVCFRYIFF